MCQRNAYLPQNISVWKKHEEEDSIELEPKPRQQKLKEFVQAQTDWPGTQIERFFSGLGPDW